ncbi:putative Peptidase C19, ubiquitin carboxyl-terminal hydrolase [Trypanosoma cruzi]|uniref:ubiquitinyl hydrolase 1 n=2 Tax=Trypanosoma cruzi TaxID=5693 RepID=Q4D0S8_TRYCC|nr:ubiquitin hydrolase, putative [Trypanosoma cruzi]EAN86131.1 ubiquitin hydrolase, putative [Trypanosoma cruzi]PWV16307.1 putative Peptidase C19, ubiquitin carboxyl-terminal hydrolase [Trypanosoma cruzi]RNC57383.1 putative ubiquitin hydrolase [Trypanosoma cruzi]|eukprot:XP_807982.1 ubiquitin hydrolase [Trypanosoma cruzi strain CL Brener]
MKYGRKVLEAESKRTENSRGYALQGDDGYLKHNQAFPLAHGSHSTSPMRKNTYAGVCGNDHADGDCVDGDIREREGEKPYSMGMSDHQIHRRYRTNHSNKDDALKQTNTQNSPASGRLLYSPVLKKNRVEAISPVNGGANGKATRAMSSTEARRGLFDMSEKKSTGTGGETAVTPSRYAAPCYGKPNEGISPYDSRAGGDHYAAPTINSRLKEYSSWNHAPLTLGLSLPDTHRKCSEPVTAGTSLQKRSRWHLAWGDHDNNESTIGKMALTREGEGGAGVNTSTTGNTSKSIPSYLLYCFSKVGARETATTSKNVTTPLTAPYIGMPKQRLLAPFKPPPAAPPPTSAETETATAKTHLTSPPLRAAVSPHFFGAYRQYRLASESPQSGSQESPGHREKSPYAAAGSSMFPGEAYYDTKRPESRFSLLHGASEKEAYALSSSVANNSMLHHYSRGFYGPPLLDRGSSFLSGFINPHNDCYACSVLTLLLRSPYFCRALHDAHKLELSPKLSETPDSDAFSGDGTGDMGTMYPRWSFIPNKRHRGPSFNSVHQILLHFARLLEKPEKIMYGIDMAPLRQFFSTSFFSGEQQDAHEFFLSVINKLEEESMEELKSRKAKKEKSDDGNNTMTSEYGGNHILNDENTGEEKDVENNVIIDSSLIWINKLIGGKLLNIIRCRNEGCGHEIVTKDSYINLCINLRIEETMMADSTLTPPSSAADNREFAPDGPVGISSSKPPEVKLDELLLRETFEKKSTINRCDDVQTLLDYNLRYVSIDKYICDACGSSQNQDQGGSLLGPAPPILAIQLNRYSTVVNSYNDVRVVKDKTPVFINNELTLYALREEGQFDCDKKQLAPCVREAERVARLREQHAEKRHQQEGEDTGKLAIDPSGAGENASNGSSAEQMDKKEKEEEEDAETHVDAIRCLYRLRGLVRHIGFSPFVGHYVAEFATDAAASESPKVESTTTTTSTTGSSDVDTEGGKPSRVWHIADDIRVEVLPLEYLQKRRSRSTDSYLLLYEKVAEEEVSCPVWRVLPRGKN